MVVDVSITLSWFFDDEVSSFTEEVLDRIARVPTWVPALWSLEFVNALLNAQRRGRIKAAQRIAMLDQAIRLPLRVDHEAVSPVEIDKLAERYALSAYDAAYLELAIRRALPLVTLDKVLVNAARTAKHPVQTAGTPLKR